MSRISENHWQKRGKKKAESRRQKAEGRTQKAESGRQSAEGREQKAIRCVN